MLLDFKCIGVGVYVIINVIVWCLRNPIILG